LGKANQSKNIGGHTDLESLGNINREILGNRELMMKMGEEMEGMRREMEKLKELVRKMGDEQDKQDKLLSSLNDRMGNVGSSDSARNRGVNQSEIN
jgi:predicted phage tail protein